MTTEKPETGFPSFFVRARVAGTAPRRCGRTGEVLWGAGSARRERAVGGSLLPCPRLATEYGFKIPVRAGRSAPRRASSPERAYGWKVGARKSHDRINSKVPSCPSSANRHPFYMGRNGRGGKLGLLHQHGEPQGPGFDAWPRIRG